MRLSKPFPPTCQWLPRGKEVWECSCSVLVPWPTAGLARQRQVWAEPADRRCCPRSPALRAPLRAR